MIFKVIFDKTKTEFKNALAKNLKLWYSNLPLKILSLQSYLFLIKCQYTYSADVKTYGIYRWQITFLMEVEGRQKKH